MYISIITLTQFELLLSLSLNTVRKTLYSFELIIKFDKLYSNFNYCLIIAQTKFF